MVFEAESATEKVPNQPKKITVQIEILIPDVYVNVEVIFKFYAIVLDTEPEVEP